MARVRTLPQAAAWVERAGLALLFPKADVVLPSLWEQVAGIQHVDWNREEINFFWSQAQHLPIQLKDDLVCKLRARQSDRHLWEAVRNWLERCRFTPAVANWYAAIPPAAPEPTMMTS